MSTVSAVHALNLEPAWQVISRLRNTQDLRGYAVRKPPASDTGDVARYVMELCPGIGATRRFDLHPENPSAYLGWLLPEPPIFRHFMERGSYTPDSMSPFSSSFP